MRLRQPKFDASLADADASIQLLDYMTELTQGVWACFWVARKSRKI